MKPMTIRRWLEGDRLHARKRRTAWGGGAVAAMRSKNACKTCALGMGGQMGGMVNEAGHFPEVCKKSLQAMAADMQDGISPEFFARYSIAQLRSLSPRELEACGRLVDPIHAGPERHALTASSRGTRRSAASPTR